MSLKFGAYAICKNEEKHVARWFDSLAGMDHIFVLDTGSTDNTVKLLEERGVQVVQEKIDPWRFDEARNRAFSFVPKDIDVLAWLDLDEMLTPGWREELTKAYKDKVDQYTIWYT